MNPNWAIQDPPHVFATRQIKQGEVIACDGDVAQFMHGNDFQANAVLRDGVIRAAYDIEKYDYIYVMYEFEQ